MEPVLSYNFDEIEYTVRQEIHSTSARLNAALDDLRAQIAPLQQIWTREAAEAYRLEQAQVGPGGGCVERDSCSASATRCATAPTTSRPPTAARRTPGAR